MKPSRSGLYLLLIILLVFTFPLVLVGSFTLGFGMDFGTVWGSNFQNDSSYMIILPAVVLGLYGYGFYWLLRQRRETLRDSFIREYKNEHGQARANHVLTVLTSTSNASFSLLQKQTGLDTRALRHELNHLQQSGKVTKVSAFNKEYYTLSK